MSRLLFFRKPPQSKGSLRIIDAASTILSKAELKKGVVLLHCLKCGDTTRHKRDERGRIYFLGCVHLRGIAYRREWAECLVCGTKYLMFKRVYGNE